MGKIKSVLNKFASLFKQGLSPMELTESIIWSVLLSIIPILGVSTFMISTAALKRKLNLPLMVAISYLMWPVQILLIIPFIRLGAFIFAVPSKPHSVEEIVHSFQESFFQTLSHLTFELLCGFGAWLLTAVPVAVGMYWLSLFIIRRKGGNKIS